ncbi:hypothetical protein KO525_02805 [Psychrosphaera sp. B3R10]|uniref:hypothetical protein n=1 Tax=unclassified Psychrosphaera TaxID=2641570 RepID=UPI001C07EFB3|nr:MULTISPECIES: hypothetical protein [unclassified Psychrosphaera]MBU2881199.1 hypothetical protein [Psychrosphaera sp. I2R16]MBU2988304.1 hypothetical protein [Psychrosphaera sp. B3R10]
MNVIVSSDVFKKEVYQRLFELYQSSKAGNEIEKQKHRVEGFIAAGEFMNLISNDEGKILLEQAHIDVFGETILCRKNRLEKRRNAVLQNNVSYFDEPAILRKSRSQKNEDTEDR